VVAGEAVDEVGLEEGDFFGWREGGWRGLGKHEANVRVLRGRVNFYVRLLFDLPQLPWAEGVAVAARPRPHL
jgi:hypothetical protein